MLTGHFTHRQRDGKGVRLRCLSRLLNITHRYGRRQALDRLYLDVGQGEVLALLGPNGAGKSTTISVLLERLRSSSGDVLSALSKFTVPMAEPADSAAQQVTIIAVVVASSRARQRRSQQLFPRAAGVTAHVGSCGAESPCQSLSWQTEPRRDPSEPRPGATGSFELGLTS